MKKEIMIDQKIIGKKHPCFVIAEAGVNHNGNIILAKKLVDEAKRVGVDAIKFQTFKAEDLASKKEVAELIIDILSPIQSEYERIIKDKSYLESILSDGKMKAQKIAFKTLRKVYKKIGFMKVKS